MLHLIHQLFVEDVWLEDVTVQKDLLVIIVLKYLNHTQRMTAIEGMVALLACTCFENSIMIKN
jgi:hypothetical protein